MLAFLFDSMKESITNNMTIVKDKMDIPEVYRNTPIARLILYHNLGLSPESYDQAEVLVLMCMDNRQALRLPQNFAFIVRNSGGTRNGVSFSISFTVAVNGIRHIAVIGHSDCMMVNLKIKEKDFVQNLSEYFMWDRAEAENHFRDMCAQFSKTDAAGSVVSEAESLRSEYPGVIVAPLFYSVEDHLLYLIEEEPCQVPAQR